MSKKVRSLINHRKVCELFDVPKAILMRSVAKGEFILPVCTVGTLYLFDRATIEHRLKTGMWLAGAKFRGRVQDGDADEAGG